MSIEQLLGDVRVSIRSLRRAPGFATVVVSTLAIGIAAVSALFSAVYSYQYRPLPYVDSDRIVAIAESSPQRPFGKTLSDEAATAILEGSRAFERTSVFYQSSRNYIGGNRSTFARTLWIDSSFAPLFALRPQLGRNLTDEDVRSRAATVVISDVFWRSTLAADPGVLGKTLRLRDTLLTIVGVMPPGFRYPLRTDVWRPRQSRDSSTGSLTLLGKLKPGVSRARLAGELSVIAGRLARADSAQFANVSLTPTEMVDRNSGPAALRIAFLFVGAAAFVLLIASGNVVNLFLVRAAERRGEMAVRASLGASRSRLLAHGLIEAALLSGFSAAIGAGLSQLILRFVLPMIVPNQALPSWVHFSIDGRILAFTIVVSIVVSLAVGISPALDGARPDLMRTLKSGGDRTLSRGGIGKRARTGIIVQLTFSVVLLAGALLFARSYGKLADVDLGYPAEQILSVAPDFGDTRYASDTTQRVFAKALLQRLRALPGVSGAAIRGDGALASLIESPPASSRSDRRQAIDSRLFVDGQLAASRASSRSLADDTREFAISEDYFRTLGLRVIAGRGILATDASATEKVAVVSRQFANALWASGSPLGHLIRFGAKGVPVRVVGVVDDVRDVRSGPAGVSVAPRPYIYLSDEQMTGRRAVIFRSDRDINMLRLPAERVVHDLDPMMEPRITALSGGAEETQKVFKVFGGLLSSFAAAGLVLSLIGIYGIVAYGITERTREIGIRLALGGTSGDVIQMIVRSSLQFIAIGLGIGLVMSQGTNRLLGRLVYDVSPADPMTYAIVCAVFGGVGLLSAYLPARRVSRVDPVIALRAE